MFFIDEFPYSIDHVQASTTQRKKTLEAHISVGISLPALTLVARRGAPNNFRIVEGGISVQKHELRKRQKWPRDIAVQCSAASG
jgi:hypothetical protein